MIHKLLAIISAFIILIFVFSPFILVVQGFLSLIYLFLMLSGVSLIIGVPTIVLVQLLVNRLKVNRLIKELVIAIFTIFILFLWQYLVRDLYPSDVINPALNISNELYASFFYFIISRIWYSVFMISFKEYYLKRKHNKYALITLIAHALLFLFACAAQWRLYTDPYIF